MVFGALGGSANQILIKIKGDNRDFQGAIKGSEKSMAGFASKMKVMGPMIGAAFVGAAAGFVAMSVKMAAAEEAVSRQTEALLVSQGVMWKGVSEELDTYMKQLEDLTAYNDTDLQVAFNAMIAAGMSYTDAMESMNTVTSMAYSLNRDLGSMALLVGKAYNGQTGELSRYGIVLDEGLDKTEKFAALQAHVADNFADASDRADSFEGQMEALTNETSNFAEAVGVELLPSLTEFMKMLVEGSDASGGFATKLGKGLAGVVGYIPKMEALRELNAELHHYEISGYTTAADRVRMDELRFEIQLRTANQWESYQANVLQSSNSLTDEYQRQIDLLNVQTDEMKNQTTELEKQLSLEEKKAAYLAKYGQSEGMRARGAGIDLSSLGTAGETRKSGDWTIGPSVISSVRSGV